MQAWQLWIENVDSRTRPIHDYDYDLRAILVRSISQTEARQEIEIEVMYKWVLQKYQLDSSGLANFLFKCKSRAAVVSALEALRLEAVGPGDALLFQTTLPRQEDGHFTVFTGQVDVLQFQPESRDLLQLQV